MNGPWTWMTVWGLTVGVGVRMGGEGQRGNWDNCNRITIKKRTLFSDMYTAGCFETRVTGSPSCSSLPPVEGEGAAVLPLKALQPW